MAATSDWFTQNHPANYAALPPDATPDPTGGFAPPPMAGPGKGPAGGFAPPPMGGPPAAKGAAGYDASGAMTNGISSPSYAGPQATTNSYGTQPVAPGMSYGGPAATTNSANDGWAGGGAGGIGGLATTQSAPVGQPGAFDRTQFRDQWQAQGGGQTAASLAAFIKNNPQFATGVTQSGRSGDVATLPGGERLDLITDVGGKGGASWSGADLPGTGGVPYGGGAGGGAMLNTSGGAGGAYGTGGGMGPGGFSYAPWDRQFVAPTGVTEQNDPGYGFRQQQAQQGLEQSAAAKGTLLTGGTLKDLEQQRQGIASQEYGNVYNRAQQQYQSDYADYNNNYNKAFQGYQANFGNDLANRQFALSQLGQDRQYQLGQQNFGLASQGQYWGQGMQENTNAFSQGLALNQNDWNQQFNMAQLGLSGANGLNSAGTNYGNSAAQGIYGSANAQAAAGIGGSNAWNSAAGNFANQGTGALAAWYSQHQPTPTFGNSGTGGGSYA